MKARGLGSGVIVGAVLAVVVIVALGLLPGGFDVGNPFRTETKEKEHSAVLLDLRDMSKYEAASGQFQVIVDIEEDTKYLPSWLSGKHVTFIAEGEVEAVVDFSDLTSDAIEASPDGKTATITLPTPTLTKPRLDPDKTTVLNRDRGIADRLGDVLSEDPTNDQPLYQSASKKIATSARDSELTSRAETNTRGMLKGLLANLGYEDVEVVFVKPEGP